MRKYNENEIKDYLLNIAKLEDFYILRLSGLDSSLVHYFDENGECWVLMEERNDLVAYCVEYLEKNGSLIFHTVESVKEFEKCRKIKK